MEIKLNDISKRYGYQWIIKGCNFYFSNRSITGISGPNGSGKSTLIKIISSFLSPTSGAIDYKIQNKIISRNEVYKYLTLVAPYTGLIGEYTMKEQYDFHFKFKMKAKNESFEEFKSWIGLDIKNHKKIMDYSSGMNQRLQLALAMRSKSNLLLLDEPTSFLDENAKLWFNENLSTIVDDRTIIIASNDAGDFLQCNSIENIELL